MRSLVTFLMLGAGVYVGLCVLLYAMQGRMVFLTDMPGRALTAKPSDIGLGYEDVSIQTADGERLHGWFIPARAKSSAHFSRQPDSAAGPVSGPASDPVLLFFHGNAGNISHRLDSLAIFHALGLAMLIIDYRGYGQSTGSPSEQGTYRDAEAAPPPKFFLDIEGDHNTGFLVSREAYVAGLDEFLGRVLGDR